MAVTVPDTAAGTGVPLSLVDLPQPHGGNALPQAAGAESAGMVVSDALRERSSNVSLASERQSGAHQSETDARLFLFVLLGFAAIAAWLAEVLGRKE